jgi:hypothetical protein
MKLLYLINVVGQFLLLNRFLETSEYPLFGGHVILDLIQASVGRKWVVNTINICVQGREWRDSGKFPRVTLCDFEIRVLGNMHRHTVQCVLVINMFTEKIFIFMWLWFVMLFVFTALNALFWLVTVVPTNARASFVRKFLDLAGVYAHARAAHYVWTDVTDVTPSSVRRFVSNFLRPDGVFILRMLNAHAGQIVCTEITASLWMRFQDAQKLPQRIYDESDTSISGEGMSVAHDKMVRTVVEYMLMPCFRTFSKTSPPPNHCPK